MDAGKAVDAQPRTEGRRGPCRSETSQQAGSDPRPDSLTPFHGQVFLLWCPEHLQMLLGQTQRSGRDMVVDTNACFLPCGYGSVAPWASQAPPPCIRGGFQAVSSLCQSLSPSGGDTRST